MSTRTEQRFIVHLDIPATALDPADAVQEALEQVRLGALGKFTCTVEEVGSGTQPIAPPARNPDSAAASDLAWAGKDLKKHNTYDGEFLG